MGHRTVYQAISLLPPSPVYRRPAIARRRAASFFACFALCAACIRLAASISVSVADLLPSMISRIVEARPTAPSIGGTGRGGGRRLAARGDEPGRGLREEAQAEYRQGEHRRRGEEHEAAPKKDLTNI